MGGAGVAEGGIAAWLEGPSCMHAWTRAEAHGRPSPSPRPITAMAAAADKCVANAKGCGKPGAPCCVVDGGSTTNYVCGALGAKGFYCATPKGAEPVGLCQRCPQDWVARFKEGTWEYFQCKG